MGNAELDEKVDVCFKKRSNTDINKTEIKIRVACIVNWSSTVTVEIGINRNRKDIVKRRRRKTPILIIKGKVELSWIEKWPELVKSVNRE